MIMLDTLLTAGTTSAEEVGASRTVNPQRICVIALPSSQTDWRIWSSGFYQVTYIVRDLWPHATHYSQPNLLEGADFDATVRSGPCASQDALKVLVSVKLDLLHRSYDLRIDANFGQQSWLYSWHRDKADVYGREQLPQDLRPYGRGLGLPVILQYATQHDLGGLALKLR